MKTITTNGMDQVDGVAWPRQVRMPFWRKQARGARKAWPRIEVGSDSMRLGKTTAVKVLSQQLTRMRLPVEVGSEEWQKNTYLKDAYDNHDPQALSDYLLRSEGWFARHKYGQVKRRFGRAIYIQDVHPEMDYIYALTNYVMKRMLPGDFREFTQAYTLLNWEAIPFPDLLVYLTASDEVMLKRIRNALRDFETVQERYFLTMKRLNQLWLKEALRRGLPILVVETDDFNYATNTSVQVKLAERVLRDLEREGFRFA